MNLSEIKSIVNDNQLSDDMKEYMIIVSLSKDTKLIPTLLEILNVERSRQKKLISDLNVEVSRYHSSIWDIKFLKKQRAFYNEETKKLYEKWKDWIGPCFNNKFDRDG